MLFAFFQDAAPSPMAGSYQIFFFVGLFALMYFFLLRPQAKQQKEHQKMLEALKAGDKVITNGGIWAEIDHVENQKICIRINDKTKIFVSRSAISAKQPAPESENKKDGDK
ncbi:MAG: preprotein translocase subunit YajC [Acidobacteria bacterium]|nr:preprotein translocase subunit YajC [Acidobacteriota bacterium]MCB9398911.1 preprotein translocase subunit YajC [Acidobacteriota bacterium]